MPRSGTTIATGRPTCAGRELGDPLDPAYGERGVHHLLVYAAQPAGGCAPPPLQSTAGTGLAPKGSPRRGTPPTRPA